MSPTLGADGGGAWLESRAGTGFNPPGNTNMSGGGIFQTAANQTATQQMIANQFIFAAAKSIRTSTIILATFNTIAAFATAVGILIDSYYRAKRNNKKFKFRSNGFTFVPETEVYPLVLSFCIVVQGITFAVAQSTGLDKLVGTGCTLISQLMLPAVFLAPYTQLVFGIEIAMRAFRKDQPFPPRAKWNVTICLAIIGMLSLTNFLVANFDRSPDFCLTSLFWFVAHYSTGCFAILVGITSTLIVCILIIFLKLHRSIKIEVTARVSASRMVYYLALAVISNGFMIPYFFSMSFIDQNFGGGNSLTLSMVASVVANVSGLMTGGLYLFLKSNTLSTIGPKDKVGEYRRRKANYKVRRFDPDDDGDYDGHIMRSVRGQGKLRRMDSDASLVIDEKEEELRDTGGRRPVSSFYDDEMPNPLRSNSVYPMSAMPKAPQPAQMSAMSSAFGHIRKRSYSLFPGGAPSANASKSSVNLLPSTTYSPNSNEQALNTLKPPPSMRTLTSGRHRRDSSLVSSATVQIGLRLSSVDDMPPIAKSTIINNDTKVHHLDCPKLRDQEKDSPLSGRPAALNTPIAGSSDDDSDTLVDTSPKRKAKDPRTKTLPPVPAPGSIPINVDVDDDSESEEEVEETLSPNVYSPQSPTKTKLPSPRGVGFTVPNSSKTNNGTASPSKKAATATTKSDWI